MKDDLIMYAICFVLGMVFAAGMIKMTGFCDISNDEGNRAGEVCKNHGGLDGIEGFTGNAFCGDGSYMEVK